MLAMLLPLTRHLQYKVILNSTTVDIDNNFAVRSGTTDKFTIENGSGNVATVYRWWLFKVKELSMIL